MTAPVTLPPSAGTTYDETPYPSSAFSYTHPHKLCAMGRLFGLDAADPDRARVLELGCADGANLLPMAQHAPEGRFLGLDASVTQVRQGEAAIAAAGLTNVQLRHQNILHFSKEEGKFDYIIVHGIFSWVPQEVREKILAICHDHLAENGIAYISYNAFPGWGMRMALREMMLFHTGALAEPQAKVQQARALTAFLSESVPVENNPYGLLLKQELDRMKGYADNYLRHDILEEINQPFYFYQFMQQAGQAGLQYLSETSLDQMLAANFSPKIAELLDKVGNNIVAKEQYMDFVRNRNFRQTLLCHREAKLQRNLSPASIRPFFYTSIIAQPEQAMDFRPGVRQAFKMRGKVDIVLNADDALLKAAFETLSVHGTARVSFDELKTIARAKAAAFLPDASPARTAEEDAMLEANLLRLYAKGIIDIYASRPVFETTVPSGVEVTPLARYQAMHSRAITNLAHTPLQFDLAGRHVLAACDGKNDRDALLEIVLAAVREGKLKLLEDNQPVTDEGRIRAVMAQKVDVALQQIVHFGLVPKKA